MTIKDLAKELNISAATVSRALNDSPLISEKVKEKVQRLAKEHNFRPNSVASGFRKGRTATVGVIVPNINRHYFSNVIHSIENVLTKSNYNIMICETNNSQQQEQRHIEMLINNRVSGIIISVAKVVTSGKYLQKALDAGIKVVQFDNVMEHVETSCITNNDKEGAYQVVKHLLEKGYSKIAFFNGSMKSQVYQKRKLGYLDAHKEFNITPNEALFFDDTNTREEGENAASHMLEQKEDFDAIFSSGDYAALGALLVLQKANINIPAQVGIAGFANEPFTEFTTPSITSVEQNTVKIGKIAAERFLEEIETPDAKKLNITVPIEVLLRNSTDK